MIRFWITFTSRKGDVLGLTLIASTTPEHAVLRAFMLGLVPPGDVVYGVYQCDEVATRRLSFSIADIQDRVLSPEETLAFCTRIEADRGLLTTYN